MASAALRRRELGAWSAAWGLSLSGARCVSDTSREALDAIALACPGRRPLWDYVGLIAMGQSCAEGYVPPGVAGSTLSTSQPERNVMLACEGDTWPVGGGGVYRMVPHVEPMRPAANVDNSAYPVNLAPGCEPPTTTMVNSLARMWRERGWGACRFATTNVAIGGAAMVHLRKGGDWRSYAAALEEVAIFTRLAAAEGHTYGVAAVVFTHGEADVKTPGYGEAVVALYDAFDADCRAITGQERPVVMLASQQSSVAGGLAGSPVQLLDAARQRPGRIVVTGPKYQYAYADTKHLTAKSYQALGAQYARVYDEVVNHEAPWWPLSPVSAARTSAAVRVRFRVPVPPLAWDDALPVPWLGTSTAVTHGRGFEVRDAAGAFVWIAGVAIEPPDVVRIDLGRTGVPVSSGPLTVSHATQGVHGQLADSDFSVDAGGYALRNYCCHFVTVTT